MNFYKHHIGDYDADTAHLSWTEDAAYRRLLSLYYRREAPIPLDVREAARLVRAASKPERDAVATVLREFFIEQDDGWHHKRCDEELAEVAENEPERQAKKENTRERQRRTRERRRQLFEDLRSHGIVPPFDAPMSELQALLSRTTSHVESQRVTPPVTRDATAIQTPDTRHQTEKSGSRADPPAPSARPVDEAETTAGHQPTQAGLMCRAMKRVGLQSVNPGDPRLIALCEQGATEAEFAGIAAEAVEKGKGFAWVLTVLQSRRAEAAEIALKPQAAGRHQSAADRRDAVMAELTGRNRNEPPRTSAGTGAASDDVVDVTARVVD